MLKDMIDPRKITHLEIGYIADTRYEDKYKPNSAAQISLPDP